MRKQIGRLFTFMLSKTNTYRFGGKYIIPQTNVTQIAGADKNYIKMKIKLEQIAKDLQLLFDDISIAKNV